MAKLEDIKRKIEEIKNSDFQVEETKFHNQKIKYSKLLRKALLCVNAIWDIEDASKEEKIKLKNELSEAMKSKLKALNPDFSEETLNNMICSYDRGYVIFPFDIFVVDDAVFQKEGILDDFGNLYKINTFMFEGIKPYYSVSNIDFIYEDFLFGSHKEHLTREEAMFTSKTISDFINLHYGSNITKPLYESNTEHVHYGYSGLTRGEDYGANVYINMKHNDIGRSMKAKSECDIKFCVQKGDQITLYTVHQVFDGDKPLWILTNTNHDVWRLTEAASKAKKGDASKVMLKKPDEVQEGH